MIKLWRWNRPWRFRLSLLGAWSPLSERSWDIKRDSPTPMSRRFLRHPSTARHPPQKNAPQERSEVEAAFGSRSLYEGDLILRVGSAEINKANDPARNAKVYWCSHPFYRIARPQLCQEVKINGPALAAVNVGARLGSRATPIPIKASQEWMDRLKNFKTPDYRWKGECAFWRTRKQPPERPVECCLMDQGFVEGGRKKTEQGRSSFPWNHYEADSADADTTIGQSIWSWPEGPVKFPSNLNNTSAPALRRRVQTLVSFHTLRLWAYLFHFTGPQGNSDFVERFGLHFPDRSSIAWLAHLISSVRNGGIFSKPIREGEPIMEKELDRRSFLKATALTGRPCLLVTSFLKRVRPKYGCYPGIWKIIITVITDNLADATRPHYKIARRHLGTGSFSKEQLHANMVYRIMSKPQLTANPNQFLFDFATDFQGVKRNIAFVKDWFKKNWSLGTESWPFRPPSSF